MSDKSYERAVQVLKERIGTRWEGSDVDGRAEMAAVLEQHLGVTRGTADDLIDALIESGELRYQREGRDGLDGREGRDGRDGLEVGIDSVIPAAPGAVIGGAPLGSGIGGTPVVPVVPGVLARGYWQIGSGGSASGVEPLVREGQIDPTR